MTDEKNEDEPSGASGGSLAWIPVTERLPDERAPYLLVVYEETGRQIVTSGEYEGNGHWTPDYNPMLPDEMVTHWMPLPAPPTDAK